MTYFKVIKDRIYRLSPVFLQNVIISFYGKLLISERYGDFYKSKYKFFMSQSQNCLVHEIDNQNKKLIDFVKFADRNSKFYNTKFQSIDIANFKGLADLDKLPIITKEELRANIAEVYTIKFSDGISSFTGGTTGKALEVVFTLEDFQERMAYLDAFKAKLGIDPFTVKKATFSGRELINNPNSNVYWRRNSAYNQMLYSTFHLSEKNLPHYIDSLNKFKPEVINGFVSAIFELAKFIKANDLKLNFKPKAIFTTSETLLPFHRELIEKVFLTKVYNQYASAEGAPFITECINNKLHYNLDTGVIEKKVGTDEILVTSFTTHGTPLIRYDIGDMVQFEEGVCECGSSHPLVKEVKGRMVDHLLAEDGSKVSLSHLADVIKGMPSCIKKVQFIQDEVNEVTLKIVIDEQDHKNKYDKLLISSLKYRFGSNTNIIIMKVDDIQREKSGKYSLIKNNLRKK
jgi:phenylacetate-CoA ligase